jgi:cyanamide hydratase
VIQLATIYDNAGRYPALIHPTTREDVLALFPRAGWLRCFADTVSEEMARKPWCHSTHIPGFIGHVLGNELFAQYG